MLEIAVVVVAVSLAVIAASAVVTLWRLQLVMRDVSRLVSVIEVEVRPVARELGRAADQVADVLAIVQGRLKKADVVLEDTGDRLTRLVDRLITPLEELAALVYAARVGFRYFSRTGRRRTADGGSSG